MIKAPIPGAFFLRGFHVKHFFRKHKAFFMHCLAFLIACTILGLCVLISFIVPPVPVKATSVKDEFEDYLDELYFEGSSAILDLCVQGIPGGQILASVMLGCEFIETDGVFGSSPIPINQIASYSGYYWYKNDKYLCSSTFAQGQYYTSDVFPLAKSANFDLRAIMAATPPYSYYTLNASADKAYLSGTFAVQNTSYLTTVSGGGTIWNTYEVSSTRVGVKYGSAAPTLSDNMPSSGQYYYFISNDSPIAGGFSNPRLNWGDIGLPSGTTIDPANVYDFIINVFNPYVEENYPDLTVYLFYPSQDPTEETTECTQCGGCNCIHNITVNVEPTVNVEVNVEPTINVYVENQFPSEWQEDYTFSTDPLETLPQPTMPTDENGVPETLPTFEMDSDLQGGLHFWGELWTSLVFASDLLPVITVLLLLAIAEWLLWKVGR